MWPRSQCLSLEASSRLPNVHPGVAPGHGFLSLSLASDLGCLGLGLASDLGCLGLGSDQLADALVS